MMMGPVSARLQQADPAQDQGPHQALAQFGFLHQHIAQPPRRHHQRFDRLDRDSVHQRGPVRKAAPARRAKLPGPWLHHFLARRIIAALADLNRARKDKIRGRRRDLTGFHQGRAGSG